MFQTQSIFAMLESMSESVGRGPVNLNLKPLKKNRVGVQVPKGAMVTGETFFGDKPSPATHRQPAPMPSSLRAPRPEAGSISGALSPSMFLDPPKPSGAMAKDDPLERAAFSAKRGGGQTSTEYLMRNVPSSLEAVMAEWDRKVIGRETRGFDVPPEHAKARQAFRDQAIASLDPNSQARYSAEVKRMGMPDEQAMEKLGPQLKGQGASLSDLSDPGVGLGDAFAGYAIQEAKDYGPLVAGMAHGAPSGMAGAAGAIGGAKLLAGRIPGIGGVLAPLIGAFGGAVLGASGEQALEQGIDSALKAAGGEAFFATLRQGLQESMAQNPGMGQTGEILGASMAAFAPNPERVKLAGKHIAEWIRAGRGAGWAKSNPEKVANIVDVAFGGATEVGVEAANQISRGNLDPMRLAEAALVGVLFNEPNKAGRRMGAAATNMDLLKAPAEGNPPVLGQNPPVMGENPPVLPQPEPVAQSVTPVAQSVTPVAQTPTTPDGSTVANSQPLTPDLAATPAGPATATATGSKPAEAAGNAQAPEQSGRKLGGKTVGKSFSKGEKTKVEVEERIVSLGELVASHDHVSFEENPAFPVGDLQNRDRSRKGSVATARERAQNLDPEKLLVDYRRHDTGAPIVSDDGIVESGNGRVMSMRIAKEGGFESWSAYQAALKKQYGDALDGIEDPVLVRVRKTDLDADARREFVREANSSTVEKLSPAEQARQDSEAMGEEFWDRLVPIKEGDIDATLHGAKNRSAIAEFFRRVGDVNEATTADGDLGEEAVQRIKRAGIYALFGDMRLAESFSQGDEMARRAVSGLLGTLSRFLKVKGKIAKGDVAADLDPTDTIRLAFEYLRRQRNSGQSADDWFQTGDLIDPRDSAADALAYYLSKVGSAKKAREALGHMADTILKADPPGTVDLFGEPTRYPTMLELVEAAIQRAETDDQGTLYARETPRAERSGSDPLAEINAIEDPQERIARLLEMRDQRAKGHRSKQAGGTTIDSEDLRILGSLIKAYVDLGVKTVEDVVRNVVSKLGEGYRDVAERVAERILAGEGIEDAIVGMGAPEGAQVHRIAPAPQEGPIRSNEDLISGLEAAMAKTMRHDKEKKGMAGSFRAQDTRVNVSRQNDLPTMLHEQVHNRDDELGWSARMAQEPWWDDQVGSVAEYGATVQTGDNIAVERGERFAEMVVAYALDPTTVERLSPDAVRWMRENLPKAALNGIEEFGAGIRALAAAKPEDLISSHVAIDKRPQKLADKIKSWFAPSPTGEYKTPVMDTLFRRVFTDDIAPVVSGFKEALRRRGWVPLPEDDAVMRLRQWRYMEQKVGDLLEHGMIDSRGSRVTKGFAEILEPLDGSSMEALEGDLKSMFSLMLSERVIEKARLARDRMDADIKPLTDWLGAGGKGTIEWQGKELDADGARVEVLRAEEEYRRYVDNLGGWGRGVFSDLAEARAALDNLVADPDKLARLQEGSKRYREWADALLKYARDNGYISAEAYARIASENDFYVSMAREGFEELGQRSGGRGAGSRTQLFHKFEGSTRGIESPLASLMAQTHRVVREVDRNRALQAFRDVLTMPPRRFAEDGRVPMDDIGRRVAPGDDGAIQIRVDGETEYWVFEPEIHKALSDPGLGRDHPFIEVFLGVPANVLRATITNFPAFAIRNRIRDSFDRVIKSRTGSPLFLPDKKNAALRKKEVAELYHLYGAGVGRGHYMDGPKDWYRIQRLMLQKRVGSDARLWGSHVSRQYKKLIDSSEMAGRITEYQAAFDKAKKELGYDDFNAHMYAANEARDLIDFTRAGTLVRRLNRYIPFFNAGVQGSSRFFASIADNPVPVLGKWLTYVGVPTMIEFAMSRDDEDYHQLPAYQKDLFWNFKLPDGTWLTIPKPFEFGVLGSGFRRLLDHANGEKRAFDGYGGSVSRTLQPVDVDQFLGAGAWQSVAEVMAFNRDLFRQRDIVPVWDEGKKLSLRDTSKASRLGKMLQQVFQVDARQIDHVLQGQFGYLGRLATDVSDLNREDRKMTGMDIARSASGVSKHGPTSNSRDVDWVLGTMRSYGIRGGNRLKAFRGLLDGAYGDPAKTRELQGAAKALREEIEAQTKGLGSDEERKKVVQQLMGGG